MFCGQALGAERKFWATPELVENLIFHLDLGSTLQLAQVHTLTLEILEGSRCQWEKLVRRNCPHDLTNADLEENPDLEETPALLQERVEVVRLLAHFLKLMNDGKNPLLVLLDIICERFAFTKETADEDNDAFRGSLQTVVNLDCHIHPDPGHSVTRAGFLLLEEVEGILGTAEQSVTEVVTEGGTKEDEEEDLFVRLEEPLLSALSSRICRQQSTLVTPFSISCVKIESEKSAVAFKSLMQACPGLTVRVVSLEGEIGGGGLQALAEASQVQPVREMVTPKTFLEGGEGARKYLRQLWTSLAPEGDWFITRMVTHLQVENFIGHF